MRMNQRDRVYQLRLVRRGKCYKSLQLSFAAVEALEWLYEASGDRLRGDVVSRLILAEADRQLKVESPESAGSGAF